MALENEFVKSLETAVEKVHEEAAAAASAEVETKGVETKEVETKEVETKEVETKEVETKEVEKKEPVVSDEALSQAVQAGIPLSQAKKFTDEDSLLQVVQTIYEAADTGEGEGKEGEGKEGEVDVDDLLEKLKSKDIDPEALELLRTLSDASKEQQKQLETYREQQEQLVTADNTATAREVKSWFDAKVASLGEDYSEVLGTGDYDDLPKDSPQLTKRDEIADRAAVLFAGYQATGQTPPPRDEVFETAARSVLAKEFAAVDGKKLEASLEKRAKTHISRAGGQDGSNKQSPSKEIADELDRKYFQG